jgi:hypothetical protein
MGISQIAARLFNFLGVVGFRLIGRACCRGACCFILLANTVRQLVGISVGIDSNRRG